MKTLIGSGRGTYLFEPASKTITFSGLPSIALEQVLTVFNATTGTMIYSFASSALTGSLAGAVLTMAYDTSAMTTLDRLLIYVDLPDSASIPTVNGATQAETLALILAELQVHTLLMAQAFNSPDDPEKLRASLLNLR